MAVTFGFYNSLNNDRLYNARQFSSLFDGLISDGVFMSIGDKLMVIPGTGLQVLVQTGRAWFKSTWTLNDSNLPLIIDSADIVLNRIDAVVLEVNTSDSIRENSIKIIKGPNGSVPIPPVLETGPEVFQYPLAYVSIPAGTSTITGVLITNKVGTTSTPFVTGILSTITADAILAQWESEFDIWFNNLVTQLSGNQLTNLQTQIDTLEGQATLLEDNLALLEVEAKKSLVYLVVFDVTETVKIGDGAKYFTIPPELNNATLVNVNASLYSPSLAGVVTVQISRGRRTSPTNSPAFYDILSTRITIDAGEYSSTDAVPAVIGPTYKDMLTRDVIRVDVDAAGTTVKGLDVGLVFQL